MIKVLFFAGIAEKMKRTEMEVDRDFATVEDAIEWLRTTHPEIDADLQRAMFAVNETYCRPNAALRDGDVLAVIPR